MSEIRSPMDHLAMHKAGRIADYFQSSADQNTVRLDDPRWTDGYEKPQLTFSEKFKLWLEARREVEGVMVGELIASQHDMPVSVIRAVARNVASEYYGDGVDVTYVTTVTEAEFVNPLADQYHLVGQTALYPLPEKSID